MFEGTGKAKGGHDTSLDTAFNWARLDWYIAQREASLKYDELIQYIWISFNASKLGTALFQIAV
jgi:hypothetical protein